MGLCPHLACEDSEASGDHNDFPKATELVQGRLGFWLHLVPLLFTTVVSQFPYFFRKYVIKHGRGKEERSGEPFSLHGVKPHVTIAE